MTAEEWNRNYPAGTRVKYKDLSGETIKMVFTRTISSAFVGHGELEWVQLENKRTVQIDILEVEKTL